MNGKMVNRNLVWYDGQRWLDAVGPNVVKVLEHFQQNFPNLIAGDATGVIKQGWLFTITEGGGATLLADQVDSLGGVARLTTGGGDNDGINMQVQGEAFTFTAEYPTYFGCRIRMSDVDQCDFIAGLCVTDSDLVGGMSEGVYFRHLDGGTALNFVLEEATVETATAYAPALTDTTWYTLEFVYEGGSMRWYVNGVRQTSPALTNLPNGAGFWLTPSLEFLAGEALAKTLDIDWIAAIQIQNT